MTGDLYGGGYGMGSGLAQMFGGMFANSSEPFKNAFDAYQKYAQQGINTQNPFYQGGLGGMNNYQNWLGGMANPSDFINKLMGQYQESPTAQMAQRTAANAGQNAASASGLLGSTPFMQSSEATANGISQQDQQQWLKNVLGINTQYGKGEYDMMRGGQQAANQMTNSYNKLGYQASGAAFGEGLGKNFDNQNMLGGALKLAAAMMLM